MTVVQQKPKIEVCFSPLQFHLFDSKDSIVVVVDILRATTVITTMFHNGVHKVIPVQTIENALEYKKKGYLVVAERDGEKLEFADFGNSPYYFTSDIVKGKELVYSTTNGTNAITMGKNSKQVIIGSFMNLTRVSEYLKTKTANVLILCAGWKDRFNLEDTLFAGALSEKLINSGLFITKCDSANASMDLWNIAKNDLTNYKEKIAHRHRLKKLGLDDVIDYCFTIDSTEVLPYFDKGTLKML
ncbi:MAG TPA: 2-phosphosulfolactate phosphatase [Bacteroidales bacterium]|nr:MAG: 2-phosphosulfolactate phosphatase [Bacteroidetes bacterium GWF2_33_38]OFY86239.1 MAG: 2-phosphosulfolactate phosphatase [Bacteroidetes bacterium RIFOXYA2_FULL_33_7]HBF89238.1 2-phosphosulfolactate phosphatase [Bacteroidales bacterium]